MTPAPNPTPVQASAPDIARRVGILIASVAALVAHRFLRDPRLLPLIIPLWNRLTHAATRFDRLMARFAANRPRKPRSPRPPQRRADTPAKPATRLPTGHAWLIRAIPYEAAAYACQLEALLAEPGTADLLAACPAAVRILRPIGRMLGLPAFAPKRRTRRSRPAEAPPRTARRRELLPPLHPEDPSYRPSAKWPRGPWPATRRPAASWPVKWRRPTQA